VPDNKVLRVLGVLGLLGMGAAHIEFWLRSLQGIPTAIGPLFVFTFIFAWVLALVMLVFPRALVALLAAVFAFATLGGYILSLERTMGIFGYHDLGISYAGGIAIASEVIGGLALLVWGGSRLLGARTATTSAAPFGATAADTRTRAKPAKGKAQSVPFGATPDTRTRAKPARTRSGTALPPGPSGRR
jgi:hypothetical protein